MFSFIVDVSFGDKIRLDDMAQNCPILGKQLLWIWINLLALHLQMQLFKSKISPIFNSEITIFKIDKTENVLDFDIFVQKSSGGSSIHSALNDFK